MGNHALESMARIDTQVLTRGQSVLGSHSTEDSMSDLERGIEILGARKGRRGYIYFAAEVGKNLRVSARAVAALARYVRENPGSSLGYSLWCADYRAEEVRGRRDGER